MTAANGFHKTTELELAMSVDTDSITNESSPWLGDAAASGDATTVSYECADDVCEEAEAADEADYDEADAAASDGERAAAAAVRCDPAHRFSWGRIMAYGLLPGLVLVLALGAGYLKWQDGSTRLSRVAAEQSVHAATESTIAILSYRPDTAERDLATAADRLTGSFRGAYTQLINDVVIPGAKQKRVSAVATIPAAASVSATENHAAVLVYVNQTTMIGDDPPKSTTSSVLVTLDKADGRWLISQFDPV